MKIFDKVGCTAVYQLYWFTPQMRSHIQKGFRPCTRDLGGVVWWKKTGRKSRVRVPLKMQIFINLISLWDKVGVLTILQCVAESSLNLYALGFEILQFSFSILKSSKHVFHRVCLHQFLGRAISLLTNVKSNQTPSIWFNLILSEIGTILTDAGAGPASNCINVGSLHYKPNNRSRSCIRIIWCETQS
jgi:hypothetical protein